MQASDVPAALRALVLQVPARRQRWDGLPAQDRARYAAWVSRARTARSARRRARAVADRVDEGRGWAGGVRRAWQAHLRVPRAAPAEQGGATGGCASGAGGDGSC